MQHRSQEFIFFSSPQQNLSKICQISMVRQQKRIFLPMFRSWTRSKKFYKIIESSSCCIETSQHWNNCLPRDEMLLMGSTLPEILMVRDTQSFCIMTFGFCDQLQKISLYPVKQIEFQSLIIDTEKLTLALSEKDIFINMKHFLAILWTFELLLHFD